MHPPREQAGGLAEASRLLQEGLQLLDQRQREVDTLLEDARERALQIRGEAEERARQITAEAERQRAELEEQVAALRSEVASLREELARTAAAPAPPVPAPAAPPATTSEVDDVPQWGRRSNPQAVRPARRRWLPPWLPFVLVFAVAAAVVATNVNGQGTSSRSSVVEDSPTSDTSLRAAETAAAATLSSQPVPLPPAGARVST